MKWTTLSIALLLVIGATHPSALFAEHTGFSTAVNPVQQESDTTEMPVPGGLLRHPFAPLGVQGAHVLKPGKWMLAYTYGHMAMDGNLDGDRDVSIKEILKKYSVAPESMDVDMHMICAMRGLTENLTAMVMLPYSFKSMTMVMRNGTRFKGHSDGIGDLQMSVLYSLYRTPAHQFVFSGGLSVPTGSINARDDTPTAVNSKLGYTMQLGSGTVDLLPTLTYMGKWERIHWGAQTSGTLRLGRNDEGYRWGDRYRLTAWAGYQVYDGLIGSLRLDWQSWDNIHGQDSEFDPTKTPGKDSNLRGGDRLDILPGLAWYLDKGPLKGNRLFIEGGVPIYQYLDGPQGKTTWLLSAGWKFVF